VQFMAGVAEWLASRVTSRHVPLAPSDCRRRQSNLARAFGSARAVTSISSLEARRSRPGRGPGPRYAHSGISRAGPLPPCRGLVAARVDARDAHASPTQPVLDPQLKAISIGADGRIRTGDLLITNTTRIPARACAPVRRPAPGCSYSSRIKSLLIRSAALPEAAHRHTLVAVWLQ